ncbi:MAG: chemotaxis protein CheW [Magnetococcales bacterium]|nr:chemotaxis protein CheW [Magnetococcales bacterium]
MNDIQQLLLLATPSRKLAVPLQNVVRVLPLAAWQPVPETPEWFLGLLNLAGEGLPILDLSLRLGLGEPGSYSIETPIVVIEAAEKRAGLVLQEVLGVQSVQTGGLQRTDLFAESNQPFLGLFQTREGELTLVLDPIRILDIVLTEMTPTDGVDAQLISQLELEAGT